MPAHECYHCKQWIEEGIEHDCWTTTEHALTKDLSEDLLEIIHRDQVEAPITDWMREAYGLQDVIEVGRPALQGRRAKPPKKKERARKGGAAGTKSPRSKGASRAPASSNRRRR